MRQITFVCAPSIKFVSTVDIETDIIFFDYNIMQSCRLHETKTATVM